MKSRVKTLKNGFGFIEKSGEHKKDFFFHFSKFRGNVASLKEGDAVIFDIEKTDKGLAAINVRLDNGESDKRSTNYRESYISTKENGRFSSVNSGFYLPKDTSDMLLGIPVENMALKAQKYICKSDDIKEDLEIKKEKNYTQTEMVLLSEIVKSQLDIITGFKHNHCMTATLGSRMIIGLGSASVFKTSITLHHTYGLPYVPGSALKGCLRSFVIRDLFEGNEILAQADNDFSKVFGTQESAGKIIFLDAYPTKCDKLELDIMNPHYSDYYQGKSAPTDDQEPTLIKFFAVPKDTRFTFRLVSNKQDITQKTICGRNFTELFSEMLSDMGIGAKTSVGYGWFRETRGS